MSNHKTRGILYLSHSADLYGAELCLLTLVTNLNKDRFLPIVVLPGNGPLKQKLEELDICVEIVPSIRAWLTRRNGIQRLLHLLTVIPFICVSVWQLRQIVARYKVDLIHTNSLVVIDGALAARTSGIPHVWHARELLIPETVFNFFFGPRVALSVIERLSDQIIAMSFGVKQTFCQQNECSKVVVIYDGLEPGTFQPAHTKTSIRSQLNIPDNALLVGEVGRVSAIKGYEDLVKAAAIVKKTIPNVTFIGVGGKSKSDAAYGQKMIKLINTYHLQDLFKLTGYRTDVSEIMSTLDLLVLPSHSEAFGRVLVEAMAAGKPVIGTTIGGIPEIIEDGVTGLLVPPGSPDDLARAIIKILRDPDLAHRMGAAGRERVKARFSPERSMAEIQKIYEKFVEEGQMKNIVKKFVPKSIMPAIRYIIYFPTDTIDLLLGRRDSLTPPTRLMMLDGSRDALDFKKNGERFLRYFIELCDLKPNEKILDVGCGVGRKAVPLTKYLDKNGRYEGFDIIKVGIEWCRRNISTRYPNFHFQLVDLFNKRYNPQGKHKASEYRFPFGNDSFDFVVLASVFTHMLSEDVENYFSEIVRVLTRGGRCFITFFLLNERSLELINTKKSTLDFKHEMGKYRTTNANVPEEAVCYDEVFILSLYEKYGLKVNEPIHYGSWCERGDSSDQDTAQDIIIATKL
jgi:glycosyltransferase involved in cell wall biosynthesis/SAM-dependent methyltransferase